MAGAAELAAPWGPRQRLVDITDLNGKGGCRSSPPAPPSSPSSSCSSTTGHGHLVNRPENKLTHGSAFNYDTVVTGIMIVVNSFLGLPWLVAATVRRSTTCRRCPRRTRRAVSAAAAPAASGPAHRSPAAHRRPPPQVTHVQQTRLTHFFIHVLVLVTIFTLQYLRLIPLPVLCGVFLYMGLVSLWTNQFYERVLLLMQPSRYPKRPYTATPHVPLKELHGFTASSSSSSARCT